LQLVDIDDFEFEPASKNATSGIDLFLGKDGAVQVILIVCDAVCGGLRSWQTEHDRFLVRKGSA
jgi:hypothetical protein